MSKYNIEASKLGKGVESLIPKSFLTSGRTVALLPVESVVASEYQPRKYFNLEALGRLAKSIEKHGLTQPIVVRRSGGSYEIIAGERRFRASKLAGLDKIPAIVKDVTDKELLQLALVENLDRENLNPIEEAQGYQRLSEEFGFSHKDIAELFSKSRSSVSNTLRLLNLPMPIKQALLEDKLSEGHARALLAIEDSIVQNDIFMKVCEYSLSVRDVENLVKEMRRDEGALANKLKFLKNQEGFSKDFLRGVQRLLVKHYQGKVYLSRKKAGGHILLSFGSREDLETLLDKLSINDG